MVQKAWGMPKEEIKKYIEFDHMYRCIVGGDKCLTVSEYGLGQHVIRVVFFLYYMNPTF